MKTKVVLTIITCCISLAASFPDERTNRMFSLFNVVKFKNSVCQATSSADLQGVCHTSEECSDLGGTADGNCAASFGVCCVVRVSTCGSKVTQNGTFIENPGFPTAHVVTAAAACAYTITRCSSDICQVRLDFINNVLSQPAQATGLCADTMVVVPGAATRNPPAICGTNTGQHMYIDAGTADTAATVTFNIDAVGTHTWRVKVSQIECFSASKAPAGCLQYFFGSARNTATSFNFDGTALCATGCMTQAQDYRVCFRTESGMCGVQYAESQLTAPADAFLLTNAAAAAQQTELVCVAAYVQIKNIVGAELVVAPTENIFCGSELGIVAAAFPNAINTVGTPFEFRVVARVNANVAAAINSVAGFSIDAVQTPC